MSGAFGPTCCSPDRNSSPAEPTAPQLTTYRPALTTPRAPVAVSRYSTPQISFASRRRRWAIVLDRDRKSTRLNSSHLVISYAVFCLKKKKKTKHKQNNIIHRRSAHGQR